MRTISEIDKRGGGGGSKNRSLGQNCKKNREPGLEGFQNCLLKIVKNSKKSKRKDPINSELNYHVTGLS